MGPFRGRQHFKGAAFAAQGAVEALAFLFIDAEGARGIGLGIEVHQKRADFLLSQSSREINRGGGFADAALLVGDSEYGAGHTGLIVNLGWESSLNLG